MTKWTNMFASIRLVYLDARMDLDKDNFRIKVINTSRKNKELC